MDVTPTGFSYAIVEPHGHDGPHLPEAIDFIAVVPGVTSMGNLKFEAGLISTKLTVGSPHWKVGDPTDSDTVNNEWEEVHLKTSFGKEPVFLTGLQSVKNGKVSNDLPKPTTAAPFLTVATRKLSATGAEVSLERSEVLDGSIVEQPEEIGYIAISAGEGVEAELQYSVQNFEFKKNMGWDEAHNPSFQLESVPFSEPIKNPIAIASKASRKGHDGGWTRLLQKSEESLQLFVDEDVTSDGDRSHIAELVSIAVFGGPFAWPSHGYRPPISPPVRLEIGTVKTDNTHKGSNGGKGGHFVKYHSFQKNFAATPIVVGLMSSAGPHAADVRIFDVTRAGFKFAVMEPTGFDGAHLPETIDFVAAVPGVTHADTLQIEAGSVSTTHTVGSPEWKKGKSSDPGAIDGQWETVTFKSTFADTPAFLTGLQSAHNQNIEMHMSPAAIKPWLVSATEKLTKTGADIAIERCEVMDGAVVSKTEDIGYIAMSVGSGSVNGVDFTVLNKLYKLNMGWDERTGDIEKLVLPKAIDNPVVIGEYASRKGNNGGWLRLQKKEPKEITVYVDEDTSHDSERSHVGELVSVAVFSSPVSFP
jgi:hypothetical protein